MNEDTLNMEIRKFLKQVGVTSQREIEHAIQKALESGKLKGIETFDVKMTLEAPALGLVHRIDGRIALE
jgi:ribosomal protein L1